MEESLPKKKIYCSMIENNLHFQSKTHNHLPLHQIHLPTHRLLEQLQLYQWRAQHSQHLITYSWTKVQPYDHQHVSLQLKATRLLTSFHDAKSVKGKNLFRNLSKIFGSFKLLYDKFGPFEVSAHMIAFDCFYEPFVWMNKNHTINEYTRDHVSQEEFAQNILRILLINADKFQDEDFSEHCYKFKGKKIGLAEIEQHFANIELRPSGQERLAKEELECSSDRVLNFTKASKLKRKNTNSTSLKDSGSSKTISYPPTKLTIRSERQQQSRSSIKTLFGSEERMSSILSNLPLTQKEVSTPLRPFDESFCFDDDTNYIMVSGFSSANRLTVSVNDSQQSSQENVQEVVVPMLDQYLRCTVSSFINPETK